MAYRPESERWNQPLGRFVREYSLRFGGTALPEALEVTSQAVYHWVSGRAHPRIKVAVKLVAIATEFGAPLTLGDVYSTEIGSEQVGQNWVTSWADSR